MFGLDRAQSQVWIGGGANGNWSTGANWNGGTAPANNGNANLGFSGGAGGTNRVDQNWSVNSLQFQANAGPFTIESNGQPTPSKLTVRGGGIENLSSQMQRLNVPVDLGAAQSWRSSGGAGGIIFAGPVNNAGYGLTADPGTGTRIELNGVFSGSGALTKLGAGNLLLAGDNTFPGNLLLNVGTLELGHNRGAGTGTLVFGGGNLNAVGGSRTIANALTLGADTTFGGFDLTFSGATSLTGNRSFTINNSVTTFGGVISQSGSNRTLTKQGGGTLILAGANSYSGLTRIAQGLTVARSATAFGTTARGVQVDAGGAIGLEGGITIGNEALALAGTGVAGAGALINLSGNNRWEGSVTLNDHALVSVPLGELFFGTSGFAARTINLGAYNLTFDVAARVEINGLFAGTGSVSKNGSGILHFRSTQHNTFTGSTIVNAGSLVLDNLNNGNRSITGPLVIGDGLGGALADVVQLGPYPYANEMIANDATVTLNSSGWLRLNGQQETVGGLNFTGGAVDAAQVDPGGSAVGKLILNGNVVANASSAPATISGNLDLGGAARTFTVARGSGATDLQIIAPIANGSLVKAGAGELSLTGAGTYAGGTTVNAGTLRVNNATGSATGSGAVTVAAGAVLAGAGSVSGNTVLNGTVSPGNGVGSLILGATTMSAGAGLRFEMKDADSGAGVGWDFLRVNGVASLAASPLARFTIDVVSLTPGGSAGNVFNFDLNNEYYWHVATATGGFASFNELAFDIRTTSFTNPKSDGFFTLQLANSNRDLYLVFNPLVVVPEPQTWALLVAGAVGLVVVGRRQSK